MSHQTTPALITKILPDSIASELGLEPGDAIVSINGQKPRDLIDYQFICADEILEIEILDSQGKTHLIEIEKDYDEDLGLEFSTALFDGLMQCNNRCPFCFIDQQPPGKRKTLYLKDDDYRLSFLYGSYLTLTNLTEKEWERIAQMRLSPLYVSVHATEPDIRIKLLKNPRAGQILEQLTWFQKNRLQIHAQVVVCPGINDGEHLEKTITDLVKFHTGKVPTVASVAIVPVGLTQFRPSDNELSPVTPAKAQEVIAQVEKLQTLFLANQKTGKKSKKTSRCVWLADEWYLIAGQELPPASHYEDYPQIGNGVGSIRQFLEQFETKANQLFVKKVHPPRKLTWVVGNAVDQAFRSIVDRFNQVQGLEIQKIALHSKYWGQTMTVTGLLTGQDLLEGLREQDLGDGILLPSVMLKEGDTLFLDDMKLSELAEKLNTRIIPVESIEDLIKNVINWQVN